MLENLISPFFKRKEFHDIRDVSDDELSASMSSVGILLNTFSIAGRRLGFEDTRGTCSLKLLGRTNQPRFLFLENVKGLLNR